METGGKQGSGKLSDLKDVRRSRMGPDGKGIQKKKIRGGENWPHEAIGSIKIKLQKWKRRTAAKKSIDKEKKGKKRIEGQRSGVGVQKRSRDCGKGPFPMGDPAATKKRLVVAVTGITGIKKKKRKAETSGGGMGGISAKKKNSEGALEKMAQVGKFVGGGGEMEPKKL